MITENSLTTDTLERFSFGRNWKNFLETVNEERILDAENSIKHSLNIESLKGKRFLDVGSGSGLFSCSCNHSTWLASLLSTKKQTSV